MNEQISWYNAKVYYREAMMWKAMGDMEQGAIRVKADSEKAAAAFRENWQQTRSDLTEISSLRASVEQKNPGLMDHLTSLL